jgi:hypothetical protein
MLSLVSETATISASRIISLVTQGVPLLVPEGSRSRTTPQPPRWPLVPWVSAGLPIRVTGSLTDRTSFIRVFPAENCQPHKSRLPINIGLDSRALTVVPDFSLEKSRFGEKVHARTHPVPFTVFEVYKCTKGAGRYRFVRFVDDDAARSLT